MGGLGYFDVFFLYPFSINATRGFGPGSHILG